jgi:hypothetical protein
MDLAGNVRKSVLEIKVKWAYIFNMVVDPISGMNSFEKQRRSFPLRCLQKTTLI